ncbi:MAG: sterol desaturase family protein [Calditrichia bacterium]
MGLLLAIVTGKVVAVFNTFLFNAGLPVPESLALLSDYPLWAQFIIFFILKDFIEWNIHRMLHTIPWLWEFHKLHHSIEEMDWIGNFRFHWGRWWFTKRCIVFAFDGNFGSGRNGNPDHRVIRDADAGFESRQFAN